MRRAVFLDRDGVVNRAFPDGGGSRPPRRVEELEILPDARTACARLRAGGYLLVVVTNQPDVARGTLEAEVLDEINDALRARVEVDDLLVCPHDDVDRCECRKPAPGMLLDAARRHDIDLSASVMVGDRGRDVEAGRRAGCKTVFVDLDYGDEQGGAADLVVRSLSEAVPWILAGAAAPAGKGDTAP